MRFLDFFAGNIRNPHLGGHRVGVAFFTFPEDIRWNAERQAVGFGG